MPFFTQHSKAWVLGLLYEHSVVCQSSSDQKNRKAMRKYVQIPKAIWWLRGAHMRKYCWRHRWRLAMACHGCRWWFCIACFGSPKLSKLCSCSPSVFFWGARADARNCWKKASLCQAFKLLWWFLLDKCVLLWCVVYPIFLGLGLGHCGLWPGQVDVVFKLCPGSEVLEARNDFPVALKLSLSQDGMYFAHLGHLRPGRSSWNFRANYVRIHWAKTKELLAEPPKGVLGLFGQPCFDTSNLTLPDTEWQVPRVVVRPENCFSAMLSKHCCHPLRPQCWGYNALLAMACCAVPFESTSTCLVSNSKFPNSNQDCRGRPLNFFRTFGDGNELRLVVGGRIWQSLPQDVNASLSVGCLFQSVVYLFHELHHLSRDAKYLQAMSTRELHLYVRMFQARAILEAQTMCRG